MTVILKQLVCGILSERQKLNVCLERKCSLAELYQLTQSGLLIMNQHELLQSYCHVLNVSEVHGRRNLLR